MKYCNDLNKCCIQNICHFSMILISIPIQYSYMPSSTILHDFIHPISLLPGDRSFMLRHVELGKHLGRIENKTLGDDECECWLRKQHLYLS